MARAVAHFSPALFEFLRELSANNDRNWFLANRARYERDVRDPALRFVADIGPGLQKISPHVVADPKPVGGSLFRVNRDTRFSKDKTPYKTVVGMAFHHAVGRERSAPGLYLQLGADNSWGGGGVAHFEGPDLTRVRDAIVADAPGWKRVVTNARLAPMLTDRGDALKRPPQGYDPEHRHIEDLKRRSFLWIERHSETDVCALGFMNRYLEACRAAAPLNRFLAGALEVPW